MPHNPGRSCYSRVTLAALMLLGVTAAASLAAPQQSPLRRVNPATGTGNCVFSPQELLKGQEGSPAYRAIRSDFREGESIHIRCYWPKPLSAYRSAGRIANEIRDKNQYSYALYWMMPRADGNGHVERLLQDMASPDAAGAFTWNQQRFDLYDDNPGCDIKVQESELRRQYGVTSPSRCLSLANFARTFPLANGLRTLRFCFKQYVEVADRTATYTGADATDPRRIRRASRTLNDSYPVVIAEGCFNYQLRG